MNRLGVIRSERGVENVRPHRHAGNVPMACWIGTALTVALALMPVSHLGSATLGSGTFVWGRSGDAVSLDNAIADDGESGEATVQMFNLLVRARPGGDRRGTRSGHELVDVAGWPHLDF